MTLSNFSESITKHFEDFKSYNMFYFFVDVNKDITKPSIEFCCSPTSNCPFPKGHKKHRFKFHQNMSVNEVKTIVDNWVIEKIKTHKLKILKLRMKKLNEDF